MPVPKKRTSHSKRNMRRSHHALSRTFAVVCSNCGEPTLRHRACPGCGQYRGKKLVDTPVTA
ncbi:MAG: 50S ribosomal protein L32 [Oligoflexia bacterium]|nr:50S ribosomal protein L32 [Oligoflexia bacterium]